MNVNINQSAFEQVEKWQNGKLSPQQKEYLQNLVTGIKNDKTSYSPPSIEDRFGVPETKWNSIPSYLVNVERFKTVFKVWKILDSVKGVNTEAEIKTRFNKPEDTALLQAYLVLNGNLKTEKGVKEIDGAAGPKTLNAVQDYRAKETPRQEQMQEQQKKNKEVAKKKEPIDDTKYVEDVVKDLKGQYKNSVEVTNNPIITITMAGNIATKTYSKHTWAVSESNSLKKISITFNLHDYTEVKNSKNIFNKTKDWRNFDKDMDKQFEEKLKMEQDKQDVENKKADDSRADYLANIEKNNNKNKALDTIKTTAYKVNKSTFDKVTLPKELEDYNRIYTNAPINAVALNKAFLSKFEGDNPNEKAVNLSKAEFIGPDLVIWFKSKNSESYMRNIKIPDHKILDGNNNLKSDECKRLVFDNIRKAYVSYIKEYVKSAEEEQNKKLNKV